MKHTFLFAACILAAACTQTAEPVSELRAPSYPLITIDPYANAWSPADALCDATTEHWTGHAFPLLGVITVDGQDYRFMGKEKESDYKAVAAAARAYPWTGRYTTARPAGNWTTGTCTWPEAAGGFGPEGRKPMTGTWMDVKDIWVRREAELKPGEGDLYLHVSCRQSAECYIDGVKVYETSEPREMEYVRIPDTVAESIRQRGSATMAAHVHSDEGRATIDMGIYCRRSFEPQYTRTAVQTSAQVLPTRTRYTFDCGDVTLALDFTAPLLPDRLELISRPVNYISYSISARDGRRHDVSLMIEAGAEWVQNYAIDEWSQAEIVGDSQKLAMVRSANTRQQILSRSGDNVRMDWGYLYLAGERGSCEPSCDEEGNISLCSELGSISKASGMMMLGYDDLYSIQYFGENLRPWWHTDESRSIIDELEAAQAQYQSLARECRRFDADLMARAESAGGHRYAELCALAYRQAISAHKLVKSPSGELLFISKENNSNGSAGTVDVTYPSAPLFLIYNLDLAKGLLNPIFEYSESGRWTKPFPAHDIGRYPLANGQYYPKDMPVEEAGNMLILSAAICKTEGSAAYAAKHWESLSTWAEYLESYGLDPEEQLCTDDFAGHFAHNTNLSIKAILGVASYGLMARMQGDAATADSCIAKAREMAASWEQMALDGDHYKLTFDKEGTWSQKYNLVWDKLLELNVFPEGIAEKELSYYLQKQERYGLPLDSRKAYTKTDWILWTATMSNDMETFHALTDPVWDFYNETTDRVPMSDWTWADKPQRAGFKARSVVGGLFIKILAEQ